MNRVGSPTLSCLFLLQKVSKLVGVPELSEWKMKLVAIAIVAFLIVSISY